MIDRYGSDVLANDPHPPKLRPARTIEARRGLVVEDPTTGFVGAVVRCYKSGGMIVVELEDRRGRVRAFPLGPGFWVDGEPVTLVRPATMPRHAGPPSVTNRALTNSGSRRIEGAKARVAKQSRLWVEGRHDAELIEHVWGDDLRVEGVVVELLDGADNLEACLAEFRPTPQRRAGVLLDHIVKGSKETRIAEGLRARYGEDALLISGHPFVDIWQAVKPERVGLDAWPDIPRGTDIKVGTLRALGWPAEDWGDVASGWQRILRSVRDWRDLSPALLGRVEELIDFVTAPTTR
ncbi:MAG: DUF3097 domain-containing protein [Actinomycetaceae bacterium]|nr:DUF3097 domain-containing protein [Actinomycetaceae bacterium]MDU0970966.1 DUF3097 domain-containing protein [Actinomycetaceae bacterium]